MKNTKTKLISSVTVLLICFAMLIGSTFAWFTDNASTGVNKIQAGNLDIEAYYQNGVPNGETTYTVRNFGRNNGTMSFETATHQLDGANVITETTWEPGKVGTKLITVENKGSLNATISLRIKLNDGGLASAMWYDFISVNGSQQGTFTERRMNSTLDGIEVLARSYTAELRPTEKVSFILAYGMDESAGNEYQGKSLEAFVTVLAKQASVESDSFGSDYDGNATYDPTVWDGSVDTSLFQDDSITEYEITTPAQLAGFAYIVNNSGKSFIGKTIKLMNDINLANIPWTPVGQTGATQFKGTFDGQDHTIKNLYINNKDEGGNCATGLFGWLNTATVKNLTIDGANVTGHHNVGVIAGYLENPSKIENGCNIINCHVNDAIVSCISVNSQANGDKCGGIVGHAGNVEVLVKDCTVTNSTISAGRDAGQVVGAALTVNVTNCSATNVTVTANGTSTGANIREEVIGRVL